MDQLKELIWQYDLFKTTQMFQNDLAGVQNEVNALFIMQEGSTPWNSKLHSTESELNKLIPKCLDDSYPHAMLRLNYAASLATIHLVVLNKCKEIDPENYTQYFDLKCDEYITALKKIIPLATAYRIEQLLGDTRGNIVGGIIDHVYNFETMFDEINFNDNFTGLRVQAYQRCAAIKRQVKVD